MSLCFCSIWLIVNARIFSFLDGCLYALGGYDGTSYLKTVECYDAKTRAWQQCAPMHFSRSCFATAVADGYLYALGGYGPSYLSTVERYNVESNTWEMVPAMSTNRINFGVGVISGCLFVVGKSWFTCSVKQFYFNTIQYNNPLLAWANE